MPAVTVDEVLILLISDVGDPAKRREGFADGLGADEPGPHGSVPRPLEDGVVCEVTHDPVEVVLIEGRRDRLEHPHASS